MHINPMSQSARIRLDSRVSELSDTVNFVIDNVDALVSSAREFEKFIRLIQASSTRLSTPSRPCDVASFAEAVQEVNAANTVISGIRMQQLILIISCRASQEPWRLWEAVLAAQGWTRPYKPLPCSPSR